MRKTGGWSLMLAMLALLLLSTGCGAETEPEGSVAEKEVQTTGVLVADPEQAVLDVYATLPETRTEELTDTMFAELFPELADCVESYVGRTSDATAGLADMMILQPVPGEKDGRANREVVHDALRIYQDKRIREFENYDILDALTIATEAEVFVQGDYVVLLMLPDNETARQIVDQYIPL